MASHGGPIDGSPSLVTLDGSPSLAALQEQFQAALMGGARDILALIRPNSRTTNEVLLGVYVHAYVARLIDIIRNDHPVLERYMGDEAFDAMARAYVSRFPSRTTNARWVARHVPDFLREGDYAAHRELSEIAAIERALANAFDAPDQEVLTLERLAEQLPPEMWGNMQLIPHSSVTVLLHSTNAFDIWRAIKGDAEPPSVTTGEVHAVLVYRDGAVPMGRVMGPEEAMMWVEGEKGAPFGRLCELVAAFDDPATAPMRAAQHLAGWLRAGVFSEARVV